VGSTLVLRISLRHYGVAPLTFRARTSPQGESVARKDSSFVSATAYLGQPEGDEQALPARVGFLDRVLEGVVQLRPLNLLHPVQDVFAVARASSFRCRMRPS